MSKPSTTHLENQGIHDLHDSYAVNERNEPVTVVGTMGQAADVRPKIPFKAFVVVFICALASFQNVFFGCVVICLVLFPWN